MNTNNVRPAQLTDAPTLAKMMVEFYAEGGFTLEREAAQRAFEGLLRMPALGGVWVLDHNGMAAGFIVLTVGYAMEYGGLRGFVDDFFVRPSYRRRGLGRVALAAVTAHCVATGVRALFVQAGGGNDTAQRVYQRAGFVESGQALLVMPLAAPIHNA
jgi:GNAT superfamily N-acetyltransferase